MEKEKGCSSCPYAGHIELIECPDAYTEKAKFCNLYDRKKIDETNGENR